MKNRLGKTVGTLVEKEVRKRMAENMAYLSEAATAFYVNASIVVLRDKFDFDAEQLKQFQEAMDFQTECFLGDRYSLDDIVELSNKMKEGDE